MISLRKAWGALALALGVLVLTGTALAANGGGNGNGNGTPPAAPPGQEKKAETPAPPAATPAQPAQPAAKAAQAPKKAEPAKKAQPAPKPAPKPKAAKAAKPAPKPKAAAPAPKPKAAPAPKVTICHATGSATNPYVAITVSRNGLNGHGHHDDLVPAPAGGCPQGAPAQAAGEKESKAAEHAHDKVTLCHATGSSTNPYVVITIARAGWENGHSKHEDDLMPVPAGGCPAAAAAVQDAVKEVKSDTSSCPATETRTERVLVGVWHHTGSKTNPYVLISPSATSAHLDKHTDDIPVYETRTIVVSTAQVCATTVTAPPAAAVAATTATAPTASTAATAGTAATPISAAAQPAEGGVAGVSATLPQPRKADRGGVLGATARLGETAVSGRLPFTGLPLWSVALAGAALVAAGLLLRRRRGPDRA